MAPYKYRIVGTDINEYHIHLSDCDVRYIVPEGTNAFYLDVLKEVIEIEGVDFVHPQPDAEVLAIAGRKLEALTFLPSKHVIELCHDKFLTNYELKRAEVPVPESFLLITRQDAYDIMGHLGGPLWLRAVHGAGSKAALLVKSAEQANGWIDYWQNVKGLGYRDFMLSEYLPGFDYAWTSLWKDGVLLCSQARRRIWYLYGFLSPSGTSSTPSVAVTVNNPKVNDAATRAVQAVDRKPNGVYCVDLKENTEGIPCVTEINAGRFFTTINFFAEAGLNFPYAYLQAAFGFELPKYEQYDNLPPGLFWVRMVDMGYKLMTQTEIDKVSHI
jgi:carbamoyl-phosphate synthase large subunit